MAQGKAFIPTDEHRELVLELTSKGLPFTQIAALIDFIDEETLKKHFKKELLIGKAQANRQIGGKMFQKAMEGDTTALIWWSKTQMGWKETKAVEVEHSGTIDTKSSDEITREAQEIAARLNG